MCEVTRASPCSLVTIFGRGTAANTKDPNNICRKQIVLFFSPVCENKVACFVRGIYRIRMCKKKKKNTNKKLLKEWMSRPLTFKRIQYILSDAQS